MKKIILLILVGCIAFATLDAQVKRQYRDIDFAATTVVVKEGEGMSDIDILNAQFDLEEVSMGDVIRITTEKDRPVIVKQDNFSTAEMPTTAEIPINQELVIQETTEPESIGEVLPEALIVGYYQIEEGLVDVNEPVAVPNATPVSTRVQQNTNRAKGGNYANSSSSRGSSKSASYKKKRKKKFYLKKHRKVKRKRYNKCYAF